MRYSLRGLTATAAIALLAPVAAQAQDKKPLTFGELQTIRVMAGGMVGEALGQALGKNMG